KDRQRLDLDALFITDRFVAGDGYETNAIRLRIWLLIRDSGFLAHALYPSLTFAPVAVAVLVVALVLQLIEIEHHVGAAFQIALEPVERDAHHVAVMHAAAAGDVRYL